MQAILRRSLLLCPADTINWPINWVSEKPDALILDTSGLVHPDSRLSARQRLRELVTAVSSELEVHVRLSPGEVEEDLRSAVWPGLTGVVLSGAYTPSEVSQLEDQLADLENQRSMPPGSVEIILNLDSGQTLWNMHALALASPRIRSLILGMGDQLFEFLDEEESLPFYAGPVPRFPSPYYTWGRFVCLCTMVGAQPLCLLGTSVAPGEIDLNQFQRAVGMARTLGFQGGVLFQVESVQACNEGFCPTALRGGDRWFLLSA